MQSQEEVERICYDNVLAQAERHMEGAGVRTSGRCRECAHCAWGSDHLDVSKWIRDKLVDTVGICEADDGPYIVELDSEHGDECWEEAL